MPSKVRKLTKQSTASQGRAKSEELGDGHFTTNINQRTGRPIRKSAGRKSLNPGYLDSFEVIEDHQEDTASDDEYDEDEETTLIKRPKKALNSVIRLRKRARTPTPSPSPPPLSPMHPPDLPTQEDGASPSQSESELEALTDDYQPITITLNIPPGQEGPIHLHLNVADLLRGRSATRTIAPKPQGTKRRVRTPRDRTSGANGLTTPQSKAADDNKVGFLDLPSELRNIVYRHLFVVKNPFDFNKPSNFCRSSAFLATCRQVYEEGRSILYGENSFAFERNKMSRSHYWEADHKEIGYKDMRRFLESIGNTNLAHIREMCIWFDDGVPSTTPHLQNAEARRFVHDPHIIECLRKISRHAKLKKLRLCFHGRKMLAKTDYRFLKALKEIKADTVSIVSHPRSDNYYWGPPKVQPDLKTQLVKDMAREEKLYETEKEKEKEMQNAKERDEQKKKLIEKYGDSYSYETLLFLDGRNE